MLAPKKKALLVGIDSYATQPLSCCVNDATEMDAVLSMQEYGFSTQRILNQYATLQGLRDCLYSFFDRDADVFLIYFAGHGVRDQYDVYFRTFDADGRANRGLAMSQLNTVLATVCEDPSRNPPTVILIFDFCHAGGADITPRGETRVTTTDLIKSFTAGHHSYVLFAACTGEESAWEKDGHGLFTAQLLRSLMGEAANSEGQITLMAIVDYVLRAFKDISSQTPVARAALFGHFVLGDGFDKRLVVSSTVDVASIVEEGRAHLRRYHQIYVGNAADETKWKEAGQYACCQALAPIIDWFERQPQAIRQVPVFRELALRLDSRLAQLCVLDEGMRTPEGHLTKLIGAGSFGRVWEVAGSNGKSAFKAYHANEIHVVEKLRRFRQGYRAMEQLDHPHIVKVHRFVKAPLGFFMDFVEGANLRELITEFQEPGEILQMLTIVADTLRHAHTRGVVHRDVKPENIILEYAPESSCWLPYLTDFDLAWFSSASQMTKEAMGTIYYSAPPLCQHD